MWHQGINLEEYRYAITEADGETKVPGRNVRWPSTTHYYYDYQKPPDDGSTPIHRLPTKLLRRIFLYVPMFEFYTETSSASPGMSLWTSSSQVCRLWRHVTLDSPEFWTFVPLQTRHIRWIDLSLSRSHPLPIHLHINGSMAELEWYRKMLLHAAPAVNRAREIYSPVRFSSAQRVFETQLVEAMSAQPSPFLEIFQCSHAEGGLPTFGGEIPSRLRHVKLSSCPANQSWPGLYAPLTHLELSWSPGFGVLDILRRLPSLQTLIVTHSYDIAPLAQLPADEPLKATLPHLRKIEFSDLDYTGFVELMGTICIPSTAEVVFYDFGRVSEDEIILMSAALTQVFSARLSQCIEAGYPFQSLSIAHSPGQAAYTPSFRLSNPNPGTSPVGPKQITLGTILINPEYFPYDPHTFLQLFHIFGPIVRTVQTLEVDDPMLRYLRPWSDMSVNGVGQVQRINVHGTAAHGLLMALAMTGTPTPVFPGLETLSIRQVRFTDEIDERPAAYRRSALWLHHWHRTREFLPEDSIPFIEGLLQAVSHRAAIGHPIRNLVVEDCPHVTVEMIRSLENSPGVDRVDWDGHGDGRHLFSGLHYPLRILHLVD